MLHSAIPTMHIDLDLNCLMHCLCLFNPTVNFNQHRLFFCGQKLQISLCCHEKTKSLLIFQIPAKFFGVGYISEITNLLNCKVLCCVLSTYVDFFISYSTLVYTIKLFPFFLENHYRVSHIITLP